MGNGLFEVRSTIIGRRIARVLFCIREGNMVLLHGFVKKTRRTPKTESAVALKRKGEIEK
jgi:phage-related protein